MTGGKPTINFSTKGLQSELTPMDIFKPKVQVTHDDCVKYGLNMVFNQYHPFSLTPDQAGGPFAANQGFSSMPWGDAGCPVNKQISLTSYVIENQEKVVYCRFGFDYLKSFPRNDDLAIGSFKINLDYLIYQKQKQNSNATETNQSLIEMTFLKTKGQHLMKMAYVAEQANKHNGEGETDQPKMLQKRNWIFPFYKQEEEDSLKFDSVFESGNLAIAIKVSKKEYNCIL